MQAITERVLARIRPDTNPVKETERFLKEVERRLKEAGLKAAVMIGGSTAKGTFLKGDHDVDIFVRFQKVHWEENLSNLLEQVLPEATRVHGSRDYFQLRHGDLLIEVVPVLHIRKASEARNVTDVSPLHVAYVLKHTNRRLRDEIRLAKQFCKAAKCYGAESYINGFSGHVLDLLLIRYGSFERLLRAAEAWGGRLVIDLEGHHKRPEFSLDSAKRLGPAIIVDPIQPERNAAAALSREKYERFKEAARAFLVRPSLKAFLVEPLTKRRIEERFAGAEGKLFVLESEALEGKEDVVATKLLKIHEYLLHHLRRHSFTILDDLFEFNKRKGWALHGLLVEDERLSSEEECRGPPLAEWKDARNFRRKHPAAYERGSRLYAKTKRLFRTPTQAIQALLKESYIRKRCRRIKRL